MQSKRPEWDGVFVDIAATDDVENQSVVQACIDFLVSVGWYSVCAREIKHYLRQSWTSLMHLKMLSVFVYWMLIFFLQGGTVEQPSLSTNEQHELLALAPLFSQYPIMPHNQWINEEAGRLVLANPYPLFRLGELMKQACELVHSSEYNYKKGKNRFKLVDGSDAETPPTPKRPKMDTEMRQQRMQVLEEDIEALNNQMNYKRKRLQNAEINKRYDQCEVISKEIQEVKVQKRALESELAAFCQKEKKISVVQTKEANP